MQFTNLLHHLTVDLLHHAYLSLQRQAASGVDGVSWGGYGQEELREKLVDLHERIHG